MSKQGPALYVFAGGGTGGHLYPGLAIAESLRATRPNCDIRFFTTSRNIDQQIIHPFGYTRVPQPVLPWNPRPWKWPAFLKAYRSSVRLARQLFEVTKPRAVLGLGGYASAPPLEAARKCGIPTVVFNPDAVPGRANRRLIARCDRVVAQWDVTWELLGRDDRVQIRGCPVRTEFTTLSREQGCTAFGLDPTRKVLLVTGASQGASTINAAMLALAEYLSSFTEWQVLHISGEAEYQLVLREYSAKLPGARVLPFTPKLAWAMAAADVVVSRAGASTLAEIMAVGRASILMPYPYDRAKHQLANARVLAGDNAAIIVEDAMDAVENARRLKPVLKDLLNSDELRRRLARSAKAMSRPEAADSIAELLIELAEGVSTD